MTSISLDKVIKNIYDNETSYITKQNIALERDYFTQYSRQIPMSGLMQNTSFEDHFTYFKTKIKLATEVEIGNIFMLLQDYFLFSYGHDLMFKKKLEADIFASTPMEEFIYPKLTEAIKEKYNDISVMQQNPNINANLEAIQKIVHTFMDVQSLLYLLYCNDFQFPYYWEQLYPDTHEDILKILDNSTITIGDFLYSLIDFKCNIMKEILSEIADPELKKSYLEKVKNLKAQKYNETKTFAHINLPVTYFLNHTISDFLNMESKSFLEYQEPKKTQKILIPNIKSN